MMRLTLLVWMALIVRVLARRGANEAPPLNHPAFYMLGGYPYGWASYGMLDADLVKIQTEYNPNVASVKPVHVKKVAKRNVDTGRYGTSRRKATDAKKKRLLDMDDILGGLE